MNEEPPTSPEEEKALFGARLALFKTDAAGSEVNERFSQLLLGFVGAVLVLFADKTDMRQLGPQSYLGSKGFTAASRPLGSATSEKPALTRAAMCAMISWAAPQSKERHRRAAAHKLQRMFQWQALLFRLQLLLAVSAAIPLALAFWF